MDIQQQYTVSCLIAFLGPYMNSIIVALGPDGKGYKHIYGWKLEDYIKDTNGLLWLPFIIMFFGIFIFEWWIPILVLFLTAVISESLAKLFHPWVIVGHIMYFLGSIYAVICLFNA